MGDHAQGRAQAGQLWVLEWGLQCQEEVGLHPSPGPPSLFTLDPFPGQPDWARVAGTFPGACPQNFTSSLRRSS